MKLRIKFKETEEKLPITFQTNDNPLTIGFGDVQTISVAEYYDGAYEFTPSQEAQTIPIVGLVARQDITVNPIPSNYGLITWDGVTLMVS